MRDKEYYKNVLKQVNILYVTQGQSLKFNGKSLKSYLNPPYNNNNEFYIAARDCDSHFYSMDFWEQISTENIKPNDVKKNYTGFKPIKGSEKEAFNDFLTKYFEHPRVQIDDKSKYALFINGVFESVLKHIIKFQGSSEKQELFLQPYSKSTIAKFRKNPPTTKDPVKLYLSTSEDLNQIKYEALIINWEDKRAISDERRYAVRKQIDQWQPDEIGYRLTGEDGYNLLTVKHMKILDEPFHISSLIKVSDSKPLKERTQAGGWSYVTKSDKIIYIKKSNVNIQKSLTSNYKGSRLNFESWLTKQNLSLASINKYLSSIKGPISDWSRDAGLFKKTLFNIEEKQDFLDVRQHIEKLPIFKERNSVGNNMYSAALNKYQAFLSDENIGRLEVDVDNITHDPDLSEADKKSLVNTRLGQGKYRRQVLEIWNSRCSVTSYDNPRFLLASHIKPWSKSELYEKRDPYNGLLLIPNLDKAFDNGFITFKDNGEIVISSQLTMSADLGISFDLTLKIKDKNRPFLEYHQENVFQS